ncbi:MAG: hypothetical protein KDC95_08500 [Planctomycetes bacterium]|nr:hypothetical protein [Planctomycetota bacterium]
MRCANALFVPFFGAIEMTRFDEAFDRLTGLTNWEMKKPGSRHRIDLSGTLDLLERLGNPERDLGLVAQVAGSKGKGTTTALLRGLATRSGMRSATYMSPHVVDPRERILVDGEPVDEDVFADAVSRVAEVLIPDQTWYEAYTAVAILCFAALEVDLTVLEVGLGGRLDSTTVVPKDVCAITSIELEHTHVLGDTIAAIAREKAGILRPGVPCMSGCIDEADAVITEVARECGAPLRRLGSDFDFCIVGRSDRGLELELRGFEGLERLVVPFRATVQARSFTLALAMFESLRPGVAAEILTDGRDLDFLRRALPPGRFDVVQEDPPIVVDGAHTDASLATIASELAAAWPDRRFDLVFGIAEGKRFERGLGEVLKLVDRARVVPLSGKTSVEPAELQRMIASTGVEVRIASSVAEALEDLEPVARDGGLCVTGSLYAAGDALRVLRARTLSQ